MTQQIVRQMKYVTQTQGSGGKRTKQIRGPRYQRKLYKTSLKHRQ